MLKTTLTALAIVGGSSTVLLFHGVETVDAKDFAVLSFDQKLKLAQVEWYRKAADQGNIEAQFKLARILSEGIAGLNKNPELAAKLYESAARQGHTEAQNWLGYSYQHGLGVAQSDTSAIQWYRKAADSGLAVAQNNLGLMFLNGKGVPRDYAKAFTLFEQAAKQGDAWALNNLGGLYEMGWGVSRNRKRALDSYQQAFAKGNRDAWRNLKRLAANQDSGPSATRTQSGSRRVGAKMEPPIVDSKTKVDHTKGKAGEPATSNDKAGSITTEAVLSAPPLPRSKPKSLARKSLVPGLSKSANGKNESEEVSYLQWGDFWRDLISRRH